MKTNSSSLPIINLKKFDDLQRQFSQKGSIVNFYSAGKKRLTKHDSNSHLLNVQIVGNQCQEQYRTLKSPIQMQESKLKLQYRSKSVHFFKTLSLNHRTISRSQQNIHKRPNFRQIKQKIDLSEVPRLFASKSQQKIKQLKQTMYENWVPNKVAVRQAEKLPQITKEKLKQLENSFFNKCRSKHSILKLSVNQSIQK